MLPPPAILCRLRKRNRSGKPLVDFRNRGFRELAVMLEKRVSSLDAILAIQGELLALALRDPARRICGAPGVGAVHAGAAGNLVFAAPFHLSGRGDGVILLVGYGLLVVAAVRVAWVDCRRLEIEYETLAVLAGVALALTWSEGGPAAVGRALSMAAVSVAVLAMMVRLAMLRRPGAGDWPLLACCLVMAAEAGMVFVAVLAVSRGWLPPAFTPEFEGGLSGGRASRSRPLPYSLR